jgi:hypothetical protein
MRINIPAYNILMYVFHIYLLVYNTCIIYFEQTLCMVTARVCQIHASAVAIPKKMLQISKLTIVSMSPIIKNM